MYVYMSVFLVASAGAAASESDDTLATATPTGLTDDGSVSLSGTVGDGDHPDRDVDLYQFDLPMQAGLSKLVTIRAEADGSSLDAYLRLLDSTGQELANNDDEAYPGLDSSVRTYLLAGGTYYVGVSASGNALYDPATADSGMVNPTDGAYDLTLTVATAPPPNSEYEPNDGSTPTPAGSGVPGFFALNQFIGDGTEGRLDIDVFRLELEGPGIIYVDATVEHLGSTLDPVIVVTRHLPPLERNPFGGRIAINDNATLDTRDAHLDVAAFAAGPYSVKVRGAGNVLGEYQADLRAPGSVGPYDLSIVVTPVSYRANPPSPPDPLADDSINNAFPSGLSGYGQVIQSGEIGDGRFAPFRGDVDFYEVLTPAEGDVLTVDVDAVVLGSELDSVVVIFDYLGTVVAMNDNDGSTTDSLATAVSRRITDYTPTTLYVMVMGARQYRPADPLVPNSWEPEEPRMSEHVVVDQDSSVGLYDVILTLSPGPAIGAPPNPPPAAPPPLTQPGSRWLFGAPLAFPADSIVELDPGDGAILNSFAAPEDLAFPGRGLAMLDDALLFLGGGRYPKLSWLDPDNGDVLYEMYLWFGSGYYGGLAVLGGRVYVTDVLARSVHAIDPVTRQGLGTLGVGSLNDIALSGAMASLAHPNRLYLADAFGGGGIHAVDPATGLVDQSLSIGASCPCDADFDGDGDVDSVDLLFYLDCYAGDGTIRYACRQVDLDCDGTYDADDQAILDCQRNGPGVPPNDDCCPDDLPPVPLRATALGGSGSTRLYVNDWTRDTIEVYDQAGFPVDAWPMGTAFAAVGGQPFLVFADADDDGDVDLVDFLLFMDCLTGPGGGPVLSTCRMFDAEPDDDVDLDDFAAFQQVLTEEP